MMLWKRIIAALVTVLMILVCGAAAMAQGAAPASAVSDAASGLVRLLTIDQTGGYAGASAFGVGEVGKRTDLFVTTYAAVTDANGAPVQSVYILTQAVTLTVTATTPYKLVNRVGTPQDSIKGQNRERQSVTIERSLVYEGFQPSKHIKCKVLAFSSDQNFALLQAERMPSGRAALRLNVDDSVAIGAALSVVGYPDPIAAYTSDRQNLRNNAGWWTVETGTYTITAASSYVNCITGFINQYDKTGGASFLYSAATNGSAEGGALVTESGAVAGVATAPERFAYGFAAPSETLRNDYTGIYIEDVISMLERRGVDYNTGLEPETTPEPTATEAPADATEAPVTEAPVEPTEAPDSAPIEAEMPAEDFGTKALAFVRENALIVSAVAVLLVLIVLVIVALVRGRKPTTPKQPLLAEEIKDEPDEIGSTLPTEAVRMTEKPPVSTLGLRGSLGEMRDTYYRLETSLRIGRDPRQNDIVFPVQTKGVSSVHCLLSLRDGRIYIEDVGSTFGTFVNGSQRLAKGQIVELHVGDVIGVGSDRETFVVANKGGN